MLDIVEVLVLAPKLEPCGVMAGLGGTLEVSESSARVVRDELRVDTGRGAQCAHEDGLSSIRWKWAGGDLGRELEDDWESDIDELLKFGVINLGGTDWGIGGCRTGAGVELLSAIDEGEDVSGPCDLACRVSVWLLNSGLLDGEDGEGGDGCGEGRWAIAGAGWGGKRRGSTGS